jgi:23S rRNA pseudouridine1911/1915/1917 synthase
MSRSDGEHMRRPVVEVLDVPAALAGLRLDRAVAMLADLTRADAAARVDSGAVRIGGLEIRDRAHKLREHDELRIEIGDFADSRPARVLKADPDVPFTVLYEDADLLVVDKPPGVVVHPGAGNLEGTLVAGLVSRYPELRDLPRAGVGEEHRPGIVHRLDKDTSGLLVVARSVPAYRSLAGQLATRSMSRRYLALVLGHLGAPRGTVDAPIGRSVGDPTRMAVISDGRAARTGYEVRGLFSRPLALTEVELSLETGRTHQIRVHMAAIGHPVLGDPRYGGKRGALAVPRVMLHAWRISFEHPITSKRQSFEAQVPEDYASTLSLLESVP